MSRTTIVVSGVVLVLLIVAVGLLVRHNRASMSPQAVVERFYAGWLRETTRPGTAIENRLHERSTYTNADFARAVSRATARSDAGVITFDPVLCGITPSADFLVTLDREQDREARVSVTGIREAPIYVYLVRGVNDWWYIDEIDCPATDG